MQRSTITSTLFHQTKPYQTLSTWTIINNIRSNHTTLTILHHISCIDIYLISYAKKHNNFNPVSPNETISNTFDLDNY